MTLQVDELKNRTTVPFVVHRTAAISKNANAEIVIMKNGALTVNVAPLELVTLQSAAPKKPQG